MILEVAMDLMQPRLVQRIVDEGIARLDMSVVTNTGLLMVELALVGAVGGLGCTVFATLSAQSFGADLRHALFRQVQSFSFGNLDELAPGPGQPGHGPTDGLFERCNGQADAPGIP